MVRAGYALDPTALRRLSRVVLRLAFLPLLAEAGAVTVAGVLLLRLPVEWSAMLG